ncbi:putative transposase [Enterococcus sp. PF1-24]|nr:putative transposase [Enterococcus sp. PFB1-1]MDH6400585.1 putative transposase [Enterococcus sp. PF1-24]
MIQKIKEVHNESHQIYGAPKITKELNSKGIQVAQKTVANYMRENNLKACYVRKFTRTTLNSDFSSKLENILNRQFNPSQPNACWCSDITYIWTKEDGYVYLTSIMDLYSRKIIAWQVTQTLEIECVIHCIEEAKRKRQITHPLVIHSDRGSQYVSQRYREALGDLFQYSYSKKGTPWDNACIESFHALIKREWLHRVTILTFREAKRCIFEYIETFYNTVRSHSACDFTSPNQFEKAYIKTEGKTNQP